MAYDLGEMLVVGLPRAHSLIFQMPTPSFVSTWKLNTGSTRKLTPRIRWIGAWLSGSSSVFSR